MEILMGKLKPHLFLEELSPMQYLLSVVMEIENDLTLDPPPDPIYGREFKDEDGNTVIETFLQMEFKGKPDLGTNMFRYFFLLDRTQINIKNDLRVHLEVAHHEDGQHHDGTSSAHYGDPK
jgi:hypothetical protein